MIGMVLLMGLVTKNAILLVDFALAGIKEGQPQFKAVVQAGVSRLRPILMTSLSFILGVLPLVLATGAASEMRNALGITVFAGMIGVNIGVAAPMSFFPFGGSKGSFHGDLKAQGKDAISFYTDARVVISRW